MYSANGTRTGWRSRLLLASLALLLTTRVAFAAPPAADFNVATWQQVLKDRRSARILLFTTHDCEYCAAEFARLRTEVRTGPALPAWFAVVALDGPESAEMLAKASLFDGADALYYVGGDESALRHRINPRWRGETPYVVVLRADGARRDVLGASRPGTARWLREFRWPR